MLKMKKTIAVLLAVCFLVSITAAAASAGYDHEKPEVNKEVVATLNTIEVDGGAWELHLIKCTIETHHNEKSWFEMKWEFVSDDEEEEDE
jgi:type 1 fimbria pilin